MLVEKDSPLRRVSVHTDPRVILFLDGIRYSIEIIDLSYNRLLKTLDIISNPENTNIELTELIVQATSDAWSIVDFAHRLRELVQQLPQLRKKEASVQLFIRNTDELEELRNFVQHFRTEIDSFVSRSMRLWGVVSWSKINDETGLPESHSIVPGTFYHKVWAPGCYFDSENNKFVDNLVLHAGTARCNLENVYNRVKQFLLWYRDWFVSKFHGDDNHAADIHFSVSLKPIKEETEKA